MEFILAFLIQALFIFVLDHKYRMLNDNDIIKLLVFQGFIAILYVAVIPLLAKGSIMASFGYIIGSIAGSYLSYNTHKRTKDKYE